MKSTVKRNNQQKTSKDAQWLLNLFAEANVEPMSTSVLAAGINKEKSLIIPTLKHMQKKTVKSYMKFFYKQSKKKKNVRIVQLTPGVHEDAYAWVKYDDDTYSYSVSRSRKLKYSYLKKIYKDDPYGYSIKNLLIFDMKSGWVFGFDDILKGSFISNKEVIAGDPKLVSNDEEYIREINKNTFLYEI